AEKLLNARRHSSDQYQPQFGQRIILDLCPQQHGQSRALRVSLDQSQRGLGTRTAAAAEGPWTFHPAVQGPSQSVSPSRISQSDLAPRPYIERSIANCDVRDNALASGYPHPGWRACIPSNAATCVDGLGMGA